MPTNAFTHPTNAMDRANGWLHYVELYDRDTTVSNLVISPEVRGSQIHLNVVSLLILPKKNSDPKKFLAVGIIYRGHALVLRFVA